MGRSRRAGRRLRGPRTRGPGGEPLLPRGPSGGRTGARQTGEQGGAAGGTGLHLTRRARAAQPEERSAGRSEGFQEAPHPRAAGSLHPLSLTSPGNQRRKGVHRWAPGLLPAPLADMAADELSPGLLGSPAARVEEAPLPSRPASLGSPLPAGPPATAEHRARAAREDARRAADHRVHSLEGPSPRQSTHSPPASAPGRKRK